MKPTRRFASAVILLLGAAGILWQAVARAQLASAPSLPTRIGAIVLEPGEHSLYCGILDATRGYAYFATTSRPPAYLVKVALGEGEALPRRVGAMELPSGYDHVVAAVLDSPRGYAYLGCSGPGGLGYVAKVRLGEGDALPVVVGQPVCLGPATQLPLSAALDAEKGYAYFGCRDGIYKVALGEGDSLPRVVSSCRVAGKGMTRRLLIDPAHGYLYAANASPNEPGRVLKLATGTGDAPPTIVGEVTLPPGMGFINAAGIDLEHGYGYFCALHYPPSGRPGIDIMSPGHVVKMRLGDADAPPTVVHTLDTTESHYTSALVDAAKGYLYLGNDLTYPSSDVVCVAMGAGDAPMQKLGTLKLKVGPKPWADPTRVAVGASPDLGEVHIQSGVADLDHGFAYFGTDTWPGQIIKVRLLGH